LDGIATVIAVIVVDDGDCIVVVGLNMSMVVGGGM
jgi:hypothetical protein